MTFKIQEQYAKCITKNAPNSYICRNNEQVSIIYGNSKFKKSEVKQIKNVDVIFLAGGTCRIPMVQTSIRKLFPEANIIIDGELEIITATGATIHALQVLSGEIQPYITLSEEDSESELDFDIFGDNAFEKNSTKKPRTESSHKIPHHEDKKEEEFKIIPTVRLESYSEEKISSTTGSLP